MNILLTTACSLDCSYCLAHSWRSENPPKEMSLSELTTVLVDFEPDRDPVRLMGGEPTLHSQYPAILKKLKTRAFQVVVFTNGLQLILKDTTPYLPDRILLNLNNSSSYSTDQQGIIRTNLAALGGRIGLAHTILQPEFDLNWHSQLIKEMGLQPVIRLGLAHPVIGGDNAYLSDSNLPVAHAEVVRWANTLSEDGIRLSLDCGFMRCYFNEDHIETLIRAGTVLKFNCSPVIDVGPGLSVWRCLAFSASPGVSWVDFENRDHLEAWFNAVDDSCWKNCEYNGTISCAGCQGGCLARRMLQSMDRQPLTNDEIRIKNVGMETL